MSTGGCDLNEAAAISLGYVKGFGLDGDHAVHAHLWTHIQWKLLEHTYMYIHTYI